MDKIKYCNVRPNFCRPKDLSSLMDIGQNYVYGIDVVQHIEDKVGFMQHPCKSIINYKYKLLAREGFVDPVRQIGAFIVVRPKSAVDRNDITFAHIEAEYYGGVGSCTFCINGVCTCPGEEKTPYFCNHEIATFLDPEYIWGYVTKEVADAWIDRQAELRVIVNTHVAKMTKSQRDIILKDYRTPIGALVHLGIVDKELFK